MSITVEGIDAQTTTESTALLLELSIERDALKSQLAKAEATIQAQHEVVMRATAEKIIARQKLLQRNAMLRKVSRVLAFSDEGWEELVKEIDEVLT